MLTFQRLAEDALRDVGAHGGGRNVGGPQTSMLALDAVALAAKRLPAEIVHQAKTAALLGQTQIGVVLAQLQPVFGPRGEHPVGLGHAPRDQIVDQDAEIGFVAPGRPALLAACAPGGVDSGEQALGRGLLVSRGSVDLPGEEQSADHLGLQGRLEASRIEVVVFDRVAGSQDMGLLAALHRADELELDVERQRRGDPVGIDLARLQALGLEEDLMVLALREADHLVLDGGAVPRPHPFDDAGEQRRAVEAGADDLVRARVGLGDPARHLARVQRAIPHKGKHRHRRVARLRLEVREVDRPPIEARRRTGLEASHRQGHLAQARAKTLGRGSPARPAS